MENLTGRFRARCRSAEGVTGHKERVSSSQEVILDCAKLATMVSAIVCFVLAGLLYAYASSGTVARGFGFIGIVFEIMGWITLSGSSEKKK